MAGRLLIAILHGKENLELRGMNSGQVIVMVQIACV